MTVTQHDESTTRAQPLNTVVRAVLVVLLVVEAIDEIAHLWRRVARAEARWWEGVEHRQRRQLHDAELGFLIRRVRR
jgi:hypothetical protein